jgi:YaiO family outer membrane protein
VVRDEPRNLDARLALIRVELWSGRTPEAERLTIQSLDMFPGNADLIALQMQSRNRDRANEVSVGLNYDDYSESDSWQEGFVALKIATPVGAVIGRASRAERFDLDDSQFDVEAYPRFGAKTYAYLSAGFSPDGVLYPDSWYGAELYHTFPHAFEASLGMRRLNFADAVNVYTASLGKYAGNWLIGGRVYDAEDETAVFAIVRRYFGEQGQYVGLRAGQGAREEIRSSTDIDALNVREIAVETRLTLTNRWMLTARAGFGEERETEEERVSASVAVGVSF